MVTDCSYLENRAIKGWKTRRDSCNPILSFASGRISHSIVTASLFVLLFTFTHEAHAGASNFGTTGLIDIPTARMADDATLTTTISTSNRYDYFALTYQALPWLEATFRYRSVNDAENLSSPNWTNYYDRNFAAKVRLFKESYYLPQVAIGMRDFVGTGLVGSEYLVASKTFGNFDVTLGIGWGDLAGEDDWKNPLSYLSEKFSERDDGGAGGNTAGKVPLGSLFQGDNVGLFGGVSYQLESYPVRLTLERNPEYNRYDVSRFGVDKPKSDFSYGVEWDITPNLTLAFGRQQEFDWSMRLAFQADTSRKTSKRPVQYKDRKVLKNNIVRGDWYPALLRDMEQSGLLLLDGTLDETTGTAYLRIGNQDYALWADAISRATALADLYLPEIIKTIEFTVEDRGYTALNSRVNRPSAYIPEENLDVRELYPTFTAAEKRGDPDYKTNFVQNKIAFDLGLTTRVQLFDPDEPFRYGIGIAASTVIPLPDDYLIRGTYNHMLSQNFDESTRESNSVLPRVRTDIVDYLEDENRLYNLYLEKRGSYNAKINWRGFGGVLEEMYSGFGGEVLYQQYKSRLAFGASLAWVKQREPDDDFATRDYEVTTGFLSAFWATPWYNYDVALHLGQYLAKDIGGTIEVRRTFANGWSVGAWATLTDVSSEEFGEGSFDKGIFLRIPLDSLLNRNTRQAFYTTIRPVQRDGGQRLEGFSGTIWYDKNDTRFDFINDDRRAKINY